MNEIARYRNILKESGVFPFDGWGWESADDLQIYHVDYDGHKKHIQPVALYA